MSRMTYKHQRRNQIRKLKKNIRVVCKTHRYHLDQPHQEMENLDIWINDNGYNSDRIITLVFGKDN